MTEIVVSYAGDRRDVALTLDALDLQKCRYVVQPKDRPGELLTLLFPGMTADPPEIPPPGGVIAVPPYACEILRRALERAKRSSVRWVGRAPEVGRARFLGKIGVGAPPSRSAVTALVRAYVPSSLGDARFDEVTQGRGAIKGYSACGDLWNFVLFRAGCRQASIVNRLEPAAGLEWQISENLSRPVSGAQKVGAWNIPKPGRSPEPGDLLLVGKYPVEIEHASVLLAKLGATWEVGEYGQVDQEGKPASKIGHPVRAGDKLGKRMFVGWIDISKIPMVAPFNAAGSAAGAPSVSSGVAVAAAAAAIAAALIWIV